LLGSSCVRCGDGDALCISRDDKSGDAIVGFVNRLVRRFCAHDRHFDASNLDIWKVELSIEIRRVDESAFMEECMSRRILSSPREFFSGFGPSKFGTRRVVGEIDLPKSYQDVRRELRATCPAAPGVYGMIDCVGRLVYVGMSRSLRNRTLTYFQQSETRYRKESRVGSRAQRLVWEATGHELIALLRERELIRRHMPEMNVRDRRPQRLAYVYLTGDDAPRFEVSARLPKACRHYWGPVVRTRSLVCGADAINRQFRLPDCSPDVVMRYRNEPALFEIELYPRCLRGEVNRCLAPCAAATTRGEYFAQLKRARAFLSGQDDSPLNEIDAAMSRAVAAKRFEQAVVLRDTREALVNLREQLLPRADLLPSSFVYRMEYGNRARWLVFHESAVMKVATAPRGARAAAGWRHSFEKWRGLSMPPVDKREAGEWQILASWFRRKPTELEQVRDFDSALEFCSALDADRCATPR
jgi:excinuclease ABC subunit C